MKISDYVIDKMIKEIKGMMVTNQGEMEMAFLAPANKALEMAIKIKAAPDEAGIKITTAINFVKDRCKDESEIVVDETQINLFDEEGGQ